MSPSYEQIFTPLSYAELHPVELPPELEGLGTKGLHERLAVNGTLRVKQPSFADSVPGPVEILDIQSSVFQSDFITLVMYYHVFVYMDPIPFPYCYSMAQLEYWIIVTIDMGHAVILQIALDSIQPTLRVDSRPLFSVVDCCEDALGISASKQSRM